MRLVKELKFWHTFSAVMLLGGTFFWAILFAFLWLKYEIPILPYLWYAVLLMYFSLLFAIPLAMSNKILNRVDYSKLND